jgi:hypothetical protein
MHNLMCKQVLSIIFWSLLQLMGHMKAFEEENNMKNHLIRRMKTYK